MALNKKISELDQATSVDGTEIFPVVKGGLNYRMTVSQIKTWIGNATASVAGLMSTQDKNKLDGVASGATANSSDAYLRDRANHTGTQAASTINGLSTVATSGGYSDLTGRPTLTPAALGCAPASHVGAAGSGAHPVATDAQAGFLSAAGAQLLEKLAALFPGNFMVLSFQAADAAGTTSAGATAITASMVRVNSATADAADGIRLPDGLTAGAIVRVKSGVSAGVKIYPPTGGQINYAGTDVPFVTGAYAAMTLVCGDENGLLWDTF
ncbi:hypothetical protein LCM08_06100 [Salipiger pacificus]|nr:hypothetical protein [Alloyangia pacifica]